MSSKQNYNILKRLYIIISLLVMCTMLSACGGTSVKLTVGKPIEERTSREEVDLIEKRVKKVGEKSAEDITQAFDKAMKDGKSVPEFGVAQLNDFYTSFKNAAPYLAIGSIVIGSFMYLFVKGNKRIQKRGLFGFCITIPILMVIVIFGYGYLKDLYLGK